MEINGVSYPDGIRTIKEINPDSFYMLIKADMFSEWLQKNKSEKGFVRLNFFRNNSDFFYAVKSIYKT